MVLGGNTTDNLALAQMWPNDWLSNRIEVVGIIAECAAAEETGQIARDTGG